MSQEAVAWPQLDREVTLGGRTLTVDLWIVVGCAAAVAALSGYVAIELFRVGFPLLTDGTAVWVLGWFVVVAGLIYGVIGYLFGWVIARLFARDPLGRWVGALLAGAVLAACLLSRKAGASGTSLVLMTIGSIVMLALCIFGPGIRRGEKAGAYAGLPLPLGLALIIVRAHAVLAILFGVAVFPAGKFESKDYVIGLGLAAGGAALALAAAHIVRHSTGATVTVGALLLVDVILMFVEGMSQVSWIAVAFAGVALWGLAGPAASRQWTGLDRYLSPAPAGGVPTAAAAPAPVAPAPVAPAPVAPAPDAPAAVTPAPVAEPSYDASDDEESESTVRRAAVPAPRAPGLAIRSGETILGRLDTAALLGRAPRADDALPGSAAIIKLTDPERSLSRNHALLRRDDNGAVTVEDLDSVNGTWILPSDGTSQRVPPRVATVVAPGSAIRLGDVFVELGE